MPRWSTTSAGRIRCRPSGESPEDAEAKLGALVVTCKRIYDGAVELRMPFVSGKDSMKNDYRMGDVKISVPPTILITAMGKVHDVRRAPLGYAVAPLTGRAIAELTKPCIRDSSAPSELRKLIWVSAQDVVPNALGLPRVDFRRTYDFPRPLSRARARGPDRIGPRRERRRLARRHRRDALRRWR